MPTIYQPFSVLHRDSAAAAAGSNPGRSAGAELPQLQTGVLTAAPAGGPDLLAVLDGLGHDVQVTQAIVTFTGGGVLATDPAFITASLGDSNWIVTTNAGLTEVAPNTTGCILERTPARAGAVLVTEPIASLALYDVLAAWSAPPTNFSARVWVRPRNAFAPTVSQFGAFRDTASQTLAQLLTYQLEELSTRAGGRTQVQMGTIAAPGNNITQDWALDCEWATPGPLGAIWFDASDVGASTPTRTRIPVALADNSAAAFERFPAVFWRRPHFPRGIAAAANQLGTRGVDGITAAGGVPTLYVTSSDLVASEWLLQIDGVAVPVLLHHNAITGLRRPLDVWNRVIAPAITRNIRLETRGGVGGLPTDVVGLIGRLEWIECAQFRAGYSDLDLANAFVPLGQVGMPAAP
jgi:hypothetical protein